MPYFPVLVIKRPHLDPDKDSLGRLDPDSKYSVNLDLNRIYRYKLVTILILFNVIIVNYFVQDKPLSPTYQKLIKCCATLAGDKF
jgi:hypothetical protein